MKKTFALFTLLLASLACNATLGGEPTPKPAPITLEQPPTASVSPPLTPGSLTLENLTPDTPTLTPETPATSKPDTVLEHQWPIRSFADPESAADPDMADGKPDVVECGDTLRAWAPASLENETILTLTYHAPVTPTQVNLVLSAGSPANIRRIELQSSISGLGKVIHEGELSAGAECPQTLSIPAQADFTADIVIVTFAPSAAPAQIDAVELVGRLPYFVDLPVFWRIRVPGAGGMSVDGSGNLTLAAGKNGLFTYDLEGNQILQIPALPESDLIDVAADSFGNLILADQSKNSFSVISPRGMQLTAGGENFSWDSPRAVAVNPQDGNLYLLDETRIQVYTGDTAKHLRDLPIDSSLSAGLAFDPAGSLYTTSQGEAAVVKLDPQTGEILDTLPLSQSAQVETSPTDLAIDAAGNLYVLFNTSPGNLAIYMLDPRGNLLKQFGRLVYSPEGSVPGHFFDPRAIAVTPDGRFLFVCETFEGWSLLTAFNIKD